jgi:hypothetical protein
MVNANVEKGLEATIVLNNIVIKRHVASMANVILLPTDVNVQVFVVQCVIRENAQCQIVQDMEAVSTLLANALALRE